MLMFDCKITPTQIQITDATTIPSPLVAFTNSFYLQYFHCTYIYSKELEWMDISNYVFLFEWPVFTFFAAQNNCIARNEPYWKTVNDTQTGVATKSYQVHGMFIGYLVENSLWFLLSILLFFGNRLIFSLLLFYFLGCCRRNLILRNLFSRRFNEIKMAVCNLSIYPVYSHALRRYSDCSVCIGFQELQGK